MGRQGLPGMPFLKRDRGKAPLSGQGGTAPGCAVSIIYAPLKNGTGIVKFL